MAGVDRGEQGDLVAVRRCARRGQAEQYALVLAAMGMQSSIAPEGKFMALYVAHEDAARANDELAAYDSENRERPPGRDWLRPALPRVEVALVYWTVLLFFFAAGRHEAFSFDWIGEGAVQSGLMLKGEWWRAVTALCLHASGAHLLGNLVFGTVFLMLLAQVTGAGVAALAMITAGAAGNVHKCACAIAGAHIDWRLHGNICQHRPARRIAAGEAPRSCILRSAQLDTGGWRIGTAGIPGSQRGEYRHTCTCAGLWIGHCRRLGACKVGPRLDR